MRTAAIIVGLALVVGCSKERSIVDQAPAGDTKTDAPTPKDPVAPDLAAPAPSPPDPKAKTLDRPALRRLPGGDAIELGAPDGVAKLRPDESFPRRAVAIAPLWVMDTEVTQAQYEHATGSAPPSCDGAPTDPALPVVCVTWFEAARYANTLSEREGLPPAYRIEANQISAVEGATGYRMLSRDEWEYVARGGEDVIFPGTSDRVELCAFANTQSALADCDDPFDGLAPVASLRPNGFGLHDMAGNACEWLFDALYDGSHRPCGGASFDVHPYQFTRVFDFAAHVPGERSASLGLRLARRS